MHHIYNLLQWFHDCVHVLQRCLKLLYIQNEALWSVACTMVAPVMLQGNAAVSGTVPITTTVSEIYCKTVSSTVGCTGIQ